LELEVVMNEALPLCVAAERERKPNSQRTAACVRVLDAFGKVLGPEDSKLQQQYRLIVNELRRALYSPEITASDVQRYATKGSHMQVDVTLEQVFFFFWNAAILRTMSIFPSRIAKARCLHFRLAKSKQLYLIIFYTTIDLLCDSFIRCHACRSPTMSCAMTYKQTRISWRIQSMI
jgi:hypothetical protein